MPKGDSPIWDKGGHIIAEATEEPRPSFPPWPEQLESGGGIVIPCKYSIYKVDVEFALNIIHEHLVKMPEKSAMEVQTI